MSVTINTLTFTDLLAQPLGYQGSNVIAGSTARIWEVQGLCSTADYASLITIYDTFRDAKILEEDPETALVIGTNVTFSGTGPGGITWTNVPTWFTSPPEGTMVSSHYMTVNFTLVDAAEEIERIQRDATTGGGGDLEVDFGTYVLAGVTIDLTEYPYKYTEGPTLEIGASGSTYVSGPLTFYPTIEIEGRVANESEANTIRSWYESTVGTSPAYGEYFPISPPEISAEYVNGLLKYTISITLQQMKLA